MVHEASSIPKGWTSVDTVASRRQVYLWEPWIPQGCNTLLVGLPQQGKSTLLAALIASVTSGTRQLPINGNVPQAAVLLKGEEDTATVTRPRLLNAGADLSKCFIPDSARLKAAGHSLLFPGGTPLLAEIIRSTGARVCCIDPLTRYCEPGVDLNNEVQTRGILDPLQDLAAETECSMVLTRNLNKNRSGPLLDRISGSAAFRDNPRSIMFALESPLKRDTQVLVLAKYSLSGGVCPLVYQLARQPTGPPVFKLIGETCLTLDDLTENLAGGGERAEWQAAHSLVRHLIGDGSIEATKVYAAAAGEGIGKSKVWRAASELRIVRKRDGFGPGSKVEWFPPEGGWIADGQG